MKPVDYEFYRSIPHMNKRVCCFILKIMMMKGYHSFQIYEGINASYFIYEFKIVPCDGTIQHKPAYYLIGHFETFHCVDKKCIIEYKKL